MRAHAIASVINMFGDYLRDPGSFVRQCGCSPRQTRFCRVSAGLVPVGCNLLAVQRIDRICPVIRQTTRHQSGSY